VQQASQLLEPIFDAQLESICSGDVITMGRGHWPRPGRLAVARRKATCFEPVYGDQYEVGFLHCLRFKMGRVSVPVRSIGCATCGCSCSCTTLSGRASRHGSMLRATKADTASPTLQRAPGDASGSRTIPSPQAGFSIAIFESAWVHRKVCLRNMLWLTAAADGVRNALLSGHREAHVAVIGTHVPKPVFPIRTV